MSIYLQIEGIKGNVTAKGHEDWIDITSMQWGVGRAISSTVGTSADREASKPSISEVSITKIMDESSPMIFTEACIGKGKLVKIDLCTVGTDQINTYMSYELDDCMIAGYSVSTGGDRPSESITLSFTKMTMKFTPYDKSGKPASPLPAGYDMATGAKV